MKMSGKALVYNKYDKLAGKFKFAFIFIHQFPWTTRQIVVTYMYFQPQ